MFLLLLIDSFACVLKLCILLYFYILQYLNIYPEFLINFILVFFFSDASDLYCTCSYWYILQLTINALFIFVYSKLLFLQFIHLCFQLQVFSSIRRNSFYFDRRLFIIFSSILLLICSYIVFQML